MRWETRTLFTNLNSDSFSKELNPGKTKCYSTFLLLIKFPWFKGLKNKQEAIANLSVSFSLFSFLALSPPACWRRPAEWLINSPVPFCLNLSTRKRRANQLRKGHTGIPPTQLHWVMGKLISYNHSNLLLYSRLDAPPFTLLLLYRSCINIVLKQLKKARWGALPEPRSTLQLLPSGRGGSALWVGRDRAKTCHR